MQVINISNVYHTKDPLRQDELNEICSDEMIIQLSSYTIQGRPLGNNQNIIPIPKDTNAPYVTFDWETKTETHKPIIGGLFSKVH